MTWLNRILTSAPRFSQIADKTVPPSVTHAEASSVRERRHPSHHCFEYPIDSGRLLGAYLSYVGGYLSVRTLPSVWLPTACQPVRTVFCDALSYPIHCRLCGSDKG